MAHGDVLDSVTHLTAAHRGRAVYCASHGGIYAGYFAAKMSVGAVILSDAGIGREQAGVAGVVLLDRLGVPAAAIAHSSARIGDGSDGVARGRLSFANDAALRLGLAVGMKCDAALGRLASAELKPAPPPQKIAEARFEISEYKGIRVFGIDSNTLVAPADAGHIAITGSHGGLLGGRPESAIKVDVLAAVYNDAGFGVDDAGVSRLPALEARGIAAACVSCFSARIGDARSTYDDGFVSALNETASRIGGKIGQSTKAFVATLSHAAAQRVG